MKSITLSTLALGVGIAVTSSAGFAASHSGTVTVDGRAYETVTREFDRNGRIVLTGEVRVRNIAWGCDPTSAGSCEDVVQRVLDAGQARIVEGVAASPIRRIIGTR